jgi:predicted ester cyclase
MDSTTLVRSKRAVWSAMRAIAESPSHSLEQNLLRIYHPTAHWRGSHPLNEMQGVEAIARGVWAPFRHAFPDLERRDDIVMGGTYEGRDYVGCVGHLCGRFRNSWLGIAASGQLVYLRYGEFHQMAEGKIVQTTMLVDVLDFLRQIGLWPLGPSRGCEGRWAGPQLADGLLFAPQDPQQSASSLALTLAMQASLRAYDDAPGAGREGLLTMPQKDFWHPQMMWFGPSGIGTARGLDGFVDHHQLPFRTAFPKTAQLAATADGSKDGKNHYVRIGDGPFSATGGWPSRYLVHAGAGWLGLPATGRAVTMRVMDFYRADGGLIHENWVPIDMLQVLLQLDIDVLDRVRSQFSKRD